MADLYGFFFYSILCLISTAFVIALFSRSRRGKSHHLPPSPFSLPIIGHLHLLSPLPHQDFSRLSLQYGPIFRLNLGSIPCVVACSAATAKELLKTNENSVLDRPQNSAIFHMTYGFKDFAFAPYGNYWRFMKKIVMSQLLNSTTIDSLLHVRQYEINRLVKSISEKAKKREEVNLHAELVQETNNWITRLFLGERCSEESSDADDIRVLIFELTEALGKFNLSDNIWFFKRLDLQGIGKTVKDCMKRFDALIERVIKQHEDARAQGRRSDSKEKDLLHILLDISEDDTGDMDLSREHIKAFILNFFIAGTDNAALVPEWALAELINHPDIMKKAIEEIDAVVGKNRLLQESDIPNLPYLQAIIKETLRLYPPVPMIPRKSSEDCTASGYHVKANTVIFINLWALGRDPNYWDNPLEFRPERFMKKHFDLRGQNFEFLPFGSGRRLCPGTSLGLQMVHAALGAMIQCFHWKVGEDGNFKTNVDMEECPGFSLVRANPLVCVPVPRLHPIPL